MQTNDRVESTDATVGNDALKLRKGNRWLGWLAGVMAVALLALGAWMIFGDDGGQSLTAEQEQMLETIDGYLAAWNSGDGAAAAALMAEAGYHDNGGQRVRVAEGQLESFIERVHGMNFSVSRSDAAFVGNYVMTTEHIPADSEADRPSIYAMSPDGTRIMWHLAP